MAYRANTTGTYYVRVSASPAAGTSAPGDYLLSISRNCYAYGTNTPPALANVTINSPVSEGSLVTIRGSIIDPDTGEGFRVSVNFNDGIPDLVTNLPAGAYSFEISRLLPDDDPSGTGADNIPLTVTVEDRSGATDATNLLLNARNVAPSSVALSVVSPASPVEGDTVVLSGSFSDPSVTDTFTVIVNWGDGAMTTNLLGSSARGFTANHRYGDNANPYTIAVAVQDDDGGVGSAEITVRVNNANPILSNVRVTTPVWPYEPATLSGDYSDPGVRDWFTVTIDWGDGTPLQSADLPAGAGNFALQHAIRAAQTNVPVVVTLRDDDGGSTTFTTNVAVRAMPSRPQFRPAIVSGGQIRLQLQGTPDAPYRIEGSDDLISWTSLATNRADAAGIISYQGPANRLRAFYRAVWP
jgi:hypothetical protein